MLRFSCEWPFISVQRKLPLPPECRNARHRVLACERAKRPCQKCVFLHLELQSRENPRDSRQFWPSTGRYLGVGGSLAGVRLPSIEPPSSDASNGSAKETKMAKEPALPKDIASLSF